MKYAIFPLAAGLLLMLACPATAPATPIHPATLALIESGQIEPPYAFQNSVLLHEMGVDAPMGITLSGGELDIYNFNALVLLAQFVDNPGVTAPVFFDNLVFPPVPFTVQDYWWQASWGEFNLTTGNPPGATGWTLMPMPYVWYVNGQNGLGPYPNNCQRMVEQLVAAVDPFINFNLYDHDLNGSVDGLIVVHAGTDAAWTGNNNDVWSHAWSLPAPLWTADGVYVSTYAMVPELYNVSGDMTIGVYCHEMGHSVLGLPDLYDVDYSSRGLGVWSLMSYGMWNGPMMMGGSPSHLDAWCRVKATFVAPENVYNDMPAFGLPPIEHFPVMFRLWTHGAYGGEYFLVENRQMFTYDMFLPASGLLIYHIDDNVTTWNNNEWFPGHTNLGHYRVALEQCDGSWGLERNFNFGDITDPYTGAFPQFFDAASLPSSDNYAGAGTQVGVRNITTFFPIMVADLLVGNPPVVNPPAWVTLQPHMMPIFIPSMGGAFVYDVTINNNLQIPRTGQLWFEAILPNGNTYYIGRQNVTLQPGVVWQSLNRQQNIPAMAPPGAYQYVAKIGGYPNFIVSTAMFPFAKQALVADGDSPVYTWEMIAPPDDSFTSAAAEWLLDGTELPAQFTLGNAWPNPFNAVTSVSISLPRSGNLTVELFNTLGRRVQTLAAGLYPAGDHRITVNAAGLSSGIYFLTASDGTSSAAAKLVLMK